MYGPNYYLCQLALRPDDVRVLASLEITFTLVTRGALLASKYTLEAACPTDERLDHVSRRSSTDRHVHLQTILTTNHPTGL